MQITQTTECRVQIHATYDETGTCRIKVVAHAPFAEGGRTASVDVVEKGVRVPSPLEGELKAVFQKILVAVESQIGPHVTHAVEVSRTAATSMGEL